MKPAPFKYVRAQSIVEAIDLLVDHGDEARILAGGQSLLPMLNMRLLEPELLIDIGRIEELTGITVGPEDVRTGALCTHADIMASEVISEHLPLIARAMPDVAHAAVRSQGTLGGSLVHADPAAEMPACALALDAVFEARGPTGHRDIASDDFFQGLFETALQPDELLTGIRFPKPDPGDWYAFDEVVRRHGDYAMAGLAAQGKRDGSGLFEQLRLVFFAVSDRPVLARAAADILIGRKISVESISEAQHALAGDLVPDGDLTCSPAMKMHLSRVLLARALGELVE
ncbi:MAG: FAD binding domain-containing protein [Alphaproteobacteria bacterium]